MCKILICEDNPILLADLVQTCEEAGHHVTGAYTRAAEARAGASTELPDLAIIDLHLDDGNTGARLAKDLQQMGVRVLIVSGSSNVGTGLCNIPHTFASKPLSTEIINAILGGTAPA